MVSSTYRFLAYMLLLLHQNSHASQLTKRQKKNYEEVTVDCVTVLPMYIVMENSPFTFPAEEAVLSR